MKQNFASVVVNNTVFPCLSTQLLGHVGSLASAQIVKLLSELQIALVIKNVQEAKFYIYVRRIYWNWIQAGMAFQSDSFRNNQNHSGKRRLTNSNT